MRNLNLIERIKTILIKKENSETVVNNNNCPVCWGHSEWEGQHYEVIRDKHLDYNKAKYESFISKVAKIYIKTTHRFEDKYLCTTCDK